SGRRDKDRKPLVAGSWRPTGLDADGRFSFELRSRGRLRLLLTRSPADGAVLSLSEVLDVTGPLTRWQATLRTGRLRWKPPSAGAGRPVRLTATLRPGLEASFRLDPRRIGAFQETLLPAGVYELAFDAGAEESSRELEIVAG